MAEQKAMIILYKEGVDGQGLAETTVKRAEVIDAVEVMGTDFEPNDDTFQVNTDGAFIAANLTSSEIENFSGKSEVIDVVEDIDVFASEEDNPFEEGSLFDGTTDFGALELEEDDTEELEAEIEWDPDDEPTAEEFNLLSQIEPDVEEFSDFENLAEETAGMTAEQLQPAGIPKEALLKLLKCTIKCVLQQKGNVEEVTTDDIEAALIAAGMATDLARAAADFIPRNLRLIFAPQAWRYSTGRGVRVAVCDTGITPRHPDLRVYGGISYVPGVRRWYDDHGHGTHVAGTIAALANGRGVIGVAPRARLYAVKVLNKRGSGKLSWILNGLTACYRARMHIVNLSLGSRATTHNPRVFNRAYEHVGRLLRRRGILIVAAAGNDRHRPVGNPARCPSYMAVSAIDNRRRLASFSNVGPQVEVCAPGVSVLSTLPPNRYGRLSGTSMATPAVTGVAALVKARHPTWHGDRIRVHLWRTALDLGRPGRDWAYGFGQVNALRAVR